MQSFLDHHRFILAEAAVVERIRRNDKVQLDNLLAHAPLIYNDEGRDALGAIYQEYLSIAEENNCPILLCTPTWRTNIDRVKKSGQRELINIDATNFMRALIYEKDRKVPIKLGGVIGCQNDCYLPNEGLAMKEARDFHLWQVEQLANAGVDFLIAVTLPSIEEAAGIALAMETTKLPYIISFVIGSNGKILDGSSISEAIDYVDTKTTNPPLGYFINCSYPSFLSPETLSVDVFKRLIGIQANASSLDHDQLEASKELKSESVEEWGNLMVKLNRNFGLKVLGGCCGTDGKHLQYLTGYISNSLHDNQ
jgi:S-methylmethionine-dependent homocysteine/selenocysteine methylase